MNEIEKAKEFCDSTWETKNGAYIFIHQCYLDKDHKGEHVCGNCMEFPIELHASKVDIYFNISEFKFNPKDIYHWYPVLKSGIKKCFEQGLSLEEVSKKASLATDNRISEEQWMKFLEEFEK